MTKPEKYVFRFRHGVFFRYYLIQNILQEETFIMKKFRKALFTSTFCLLIMVSLSFSDKTLTHSNLFDVMPLDIHHPTDDMY